MTTGIPVLDELLGGLPAELRELLGNVPPEAITVLGIGGTNDALRSRLRATTLLARLDRVAEVKKTIYGIYPPGTPMRHAYKEWFLTANQPVKDVLIRHGIAPDDLAGDALIGTLLARVLQTKGTRAEKEALYDEVYTALEQVLPVIESVHVKIVDRIHELMRTCDISDLVTLEDPPPTSAAPAESMITDDPLPEEPAPAEAPSS